MTEEQKARVETLSHAYIVNHSEKCYVSLDEYAKAYTAEFGEKVWITHPLPLLTALGNGQGGGVITTIFDRVPLP